MNSLLNLLFVLVIAAFIFAVGIAIGYDVARRKNQKGPLVVGALVAPPGSAVLVQIDDDLSESESGILALWVAHAEKTCPDTKFIVIGAAPFKLHVIDATK